MLDGLDPALLDWAPPAPRSRICGCVGSLVVAVLPDDPVGYLYRALAEHPAEPVLVVLGRGRGHEFAVAVGDRFADPTEPAPVGRLFDRLRATGSVETEWLRAWWFGPAEPVPA